MKKTILLSCALVVLSLTACRSHYGVASIERSRILIDNRYDAAPDEAAVAYLKPYTRQVDSLMSPVVGAVTHDMAAHRPESDLSNLMADIMVWAGKDYGERPDFGVYNMGGIRAALVKGDVTYGDVVDIAPFENKICFLTLTGQKVLQLFAEIAKRGGEGVSHAVRLVITSDGHLRSARVNGKPVDPQASYRIATIDYVAQGNDQMTAFKSKTDYVAPQGKKNDSRFIIMNYFREKKLVDSRVEGRITIE